MSLKDDIKKVQIKAAELEKQSFALNILEDYKKQNKRQFIIILTILIMWFSTIGYLVYILNDIGVIEETATNTQEVTDIDTVNGNIVNKGNVYGEDKTN